ncbi:MAG: hypothetical protein AAF654_11840 [Myxococcota bacterium]
MEYALLALLFAAPPEPVQTLRHHTDAVTLRVTVSPAIPQPGLPVLIEVEVDEARATFDAETKRPAAVQVAWVGPNETDVRRATPLDDPGIFAARFTPAEAGTHALWILGPYEHGWTVNVGSETDANAEVPARPESFPPATAGNLEQGRLTCERLCRGKIPGAVRVGKLPVWIPTEFGARHGDDALLRAILSDAAGGLSPVERADLLHYLRSLHRSIEDIAPEARRMLIRRFTINEYGQDRLADAGVKSKGLSSGWVFVLFRGKGESLRTIDYDDRIARDSLEKRDKLGYVIFFDRKKDPKLRELAFFLSPEPEYTILSVSGRRASGAIEARQERHLAAVAGLGRFNRPNSMAKAPRAVRKTLTPLYLIAAELATMYVGEERDFNAFDDEFEN